MISQRFIVIFLGLLITQGIQQSHAMDREENESIESGVFSQLAESNSEERETLPITTEAKVFLDNLPELTEEDIFNIGKTLEKEGLRVKWEYLWKSDDPMEQKEIYVKNFYTEVYDYWTKEKEGDEAIKLVSQSMGFFFGELMKIFEWKRSYLYYKFVPGIKEGAEELICSRILNEEPEVIEERALKLFEITQRLFLTDVETYVKNKK